MLDIQNTLAEMSLAMNNPPCEEHTPVGGSGDTDAGFLIAEMDMATSGLVDNPELQKGMFLLLSLILDLWRRNEYAFAALNAALGPAAFGAVDPVYATRISLHNRGLHSYENPEIGQTDWRSRAMMADEIVHRMLEFTEAPHKQYLQAAMARTDIFSVFAQECGHVTELTRLVGGAGMSESHEHGGGSVGTDGTDSTDGTDGSDGSDGSDGALPSRSGPRRHVA